MLYYGASYYPEQETWEDIQNDVKVMRRAGFNITRMGEFAWIKFEPKEGSYDFSWLDPVVDLLGQNGVFTLMCTPTANPPIWMVEKHPEILYVDNRGVTRPFGGRRHYCYSSPVYRSYCDRVADAIAKQYGNNPYVIGFHIDNELGHEQTGRCHCDVCKKDFREWLEKKYGSIDELNRRMGTIFWSQTYERFGQINPPLRNHGWAAENLISNFYDNPSLRLDFERFSGEAIIKFQNIQRDAIKKHTSKPVTTNAVGLSSLFNYYDSYGGLDIVSQDEYSPVRSQSMYETNHHYAFIRGIKRKNFWVVETHSGGGHCVWSGTGKLQPFPGVLRQHAVYAYTCGAEMFNYFQMKSFRFGTEQMEAAVLMPDGIEGRRFREFQEVSQLLPKLGKYLTGPIVNDIAICYDYDSRWSTLIKPFHRDFSYPGFSEYFHRALTKAGYGCDVIPPGDDIFKYKLIILPAHIIMSDDFRERIKKYVSDGGTLVATFLTAVRDIDHNAPRALSPAGLTDLFGMHVLEGEPVLKNDAGDSTSGISLNLQGKTHAGNNIYWTESLEPDTAKTIGQYGDTFRKGEAVITINKYGKGNAIYAGCGLDENLMSQLLPHTAEISGAVRVPFILPEGVECIKREFEKNPLYCIFNFRNDDVELNVNSQYTDVLTGETLMKKIKLQSKGFRFLR